MAYKHGFNKRGIRDNNRRFYDRWQNMKTRCFNKNRIDYKNYGARGITVIKEWLNFDNFKKDMYESFNSHLLSHSMKDTTLDRIDPNKNYCKENCRWATKEEQGKSMRRTFHILYKGNRYTVKELARIFNRTSSVIHCRIRRGIDLDAPYRKSPAPKTNN